MKTLIRGKSDTNLFFQKDNLDIINYNLKKIKNAKNLDQFEQVKKNIQDKSQIRNSGGKVQPKAAKNALLESNF
jgi:hypothetical protein